MKIEIEFSSISVLLTDGMDVVQISTDLPSSFGSTFCNEKLVIGFRAAKNTGEEYVKKTFGVNPKVIDARQ